MFLDTNVLVSAFAARGLCADLFEVVLLQHELVLSQTVLHELENALRQKVKLPTRDARAIVAFISDQAAEVSASASPIAAAVDADDARILGDAIGGHVDVFVTGDAKVLALGQLGDLKIASPRAFWEMLQAEKGG